jgi:hypothetical protein
LVGPRALSETSIAKPREDADEDGPEESALIAGDARADVPAGGPGRVPAHFATRGGLVVPPFVAGITALLERT